ncbi:hypothetical protein PAHAL_7G144000 [Panicum hallii]|uniref:Uncharacterized protein n=1 Tax=Panicum hallii TaxID=206008 RepID=A0A2S3I6G2_9POAL|nr:hypothetical protein PAHAL_7G144000 [Panicum hallii]
MTRRHCRASGPAAVCCHLLRIVAAAVSLASSLAPKPPPVAAPPTSLLPAPVARRARPRRWPAGRGSTRDSGRWPQEREAAEGVAGHVGARGRGGGGPPATVDARRCVGSGERGWRRRDLARGQQLGGIERSARRRRDLAREGSGGMVEAEEKEEEGGHGGGMVETEEGGGGRPRRCGRRRGREIVDFRICDPNGAYRFYLQSRIYITIQIWILDFGFRLSNGA